MIRISGYLITAVGLAVTIFLLKYQGSTIPLKEMWFVIGLFTAGFGLYLVAKVKIAQANQDSADHSRLADIDDLKKTGEKIKITLDNCEVKSRSFSQEVIGDGVPSRIEMLDALYDDNRNYKETLVTQSYIIFKRKVSDTEYKFISRPISQSPDELRMHIDSKKYIDLYIDRLDPRRYYFDL
jgi:hypothetical protein